MNSVWLLTEGLFKVTEDLESTPAINIIDNTIATAKSFVQSIVEPLLIAMLKEVEVSFIKLHSEFSMRKKMNKNDPATSQYVLEVSSKLRWIQKEILYRFQTADDLKEWLFIYK